MARARRVPPGAAEWIQQIFERGGWPRTAVQRGGVLRRKVEDVDRIASRAGLEAAVRARGFHMVRIGPQYVILCTPGDIEVIC